MYLFLSLFSLPRRTKDEEARGGLRTKKAAKAERTLLFTYPHWPAKKKGTADTLTLFAHKKKRADTTTTHRHQQRTHNSHSTSRRCVRVQETGTYRHTYTTHSRCSTVCRTSRGDPNGRRRSANEYTNTRDGPTLMYTYTRTNPRSDIAVIATNRREICYRESCFSPSLTIPCHENVFDIALLTIVCVSHTITSYRLELLAFTEPTFAPSIAHNAATITTTPPTTTTTTNSTNDAAVRYRRYGWARGWRDSCICQDDSSLKGNIGAIAAYAVLSLEFVH